MQKESTETMGPNLQRWSPTHTNKWIVL
jgi:hypothetical protein